MPNYNKLIPSLLEHGLEALPRYCHLTPGKFDQITTSCAALKTSKEEPECASRKSGVAQPSIWPGFDSGLAIFFPGCSGVPLHRTWIYLSMYNMYDSWLSIFEPQTLLFSKSKFHSGVGVKSGVKLIVVKCTLKRSSFNSAKSKLYSCLLNIQMHWLC